MTPYHLELVLFIRCNKSLWNELTIQEILDTPPTTTSVVGTAEEEMSDEKV